MKFAKQILAGSFMLILLMAISETAIHSAVHHGHDHEEVHLCEDHDHGAEHESSICSHEHQCELCVLIQASAYFLPLLEFESELFFEVKSQTIGKAELFVGRISSAFSPRGPPRI